MGVQIFNKDVSVISSIKGIAKANISNVSGIGGWSGGGGGDVTPDPTPNWTDGQGFDVPILTSTVQIQGINVPITLSFTDVSGDGLTLEASVNTINSYGGNITSYVGPGTTFVVNPDEYVTFACIAGVPGSQADIQIYNDSDGGVFLDNVAIFRDQPP